MGTYQLISLQSGIFTGQTYNDQLPCCVFFAVLLLIVSFILATPFSLICTVPFLVCISKVRRMVTSDHEILSREREREIVEGFNSHRWAIN